MEKVKIKTEVLLDALQAVSAGLAKNKEALEQSASFIFSDNQVYTYNDEIFMIIELDLNIRGAIDAKTLLSFLSKIPDKKVLLIIKNKSLTIKTKNKKAVIPIDPNIALPLDDVESPEEWKDLDETFVDGLEYCVDSAATDMSRPVFSCVNIDPQFIEASDALTISRFHVRTKIQSPLLLHAGYVTEIIKRNPKAISTTKSFGHFLTEDGATLSCKRTIGKMDSDLFTGYLDVGGNTLTLPDKLKKSIDIARIFTDNDNPREEKVEIFISEDGLRLRSLSQTETKGWYKEQIEIDYDDDPFAFIVSPGTLNKVLKHSDEVIVGERALKFTIGDSFEHVVSLSKVE